MRPALTSAALLLALAGLLLAGCGDDRETSPETAPSGLPAGGGGGGHVADCDPVSPAEPKKLNLKPPKKKVQAGASITATVETNCGSFEFKLDTKDSPKTASSFVHLVEEGAYEDTPFNRVVPGFVIQAGDASGDDQNDPGYSVVEPPPADTEYTRGVVAMGKMSVEPKGFSGMQFFVVTAADAGLPPDYALLGKLTGGQDTVDRIDAQADPALGAEGGEPADPVVIDRISLSR